MRLLTLKPSPITNESTLVLESFISKIPPYTILSHRWGADHEEVSFKDIETSSPSLKSKKGYAKIMNCYLQAVSDGHKYLWVDTCCIDKSSSAELSEGINSMFAWYKQSMICYAYLEDVMSEESPESPLSSFRKSVWFNRGWTLQELLAPESVVFIGKNWIEIGTKASLASVISEITLIDRKALLHQNPAYFCIAKKMSWAARRTTTRVEDRAYSLLGLFGVNMAAIYGEGEKAFQRLQHEILKGSTDQTIFAWNWADPWGKVSMLAHSPTCFADSNNIDPMNTLDFIEWFDMRDYKPEYTMTNLGLQIHLPLLRVESRDMLKDIGIDVKEYYFPQKRTYLAFIACDSIAIPNNLKRATCIILEQPPGEPSSVYYRKAIRGVTTFQVDTDSKVYDFNRIKAKSITIREDDSPTAEEALAHDTKMGRSYRFLLENSNCDSFHELYKTPDQNWIDVDPDYSDLLYAAVFFFCPETHQQFIATIKLSGLQVSCNLIAVNSTVRSKAHAIQLIEEHRFSARGSSDWVSIPRQGKPGKIVATARRIEDIDMKTVAYRLKIEVRE